MRSQFLLPVLLLCAAVSVGGCSDGRAIDRYCLSSGTFGCEVYNVSLIQLIARPELFDNRRVLVTGYVVVTFEGDAIFNNREEAINHLYKNALWLDRPTSFDTTMFAPSYEGYGLVEGTFSAAFLGHMGLASGGLRELTRLEMNGVVGIKK